MNQKQILIMLLVVGIILSGWFFFQSQVQKTSQDKLANLFNEETVSVAEFVEAASSFDVAIESSTLEKIEQKIVAADHSNSFSDDFFSILMRLLALEKRQTALIQAFDRLEEKETFEDFCPMLAEWEKKLDESEQIVLEVLELNNQLDAYYKQNPAKGTKIILDTEKLENEQQNMVFHVNRLRDMCIIAVFPPEEEMKGEQT